MQTFSSPKVEPEESITAATVAAARFRANRHPKSAFQVPREAATLVTSTACSLTRSLFSPNFPPAKNTNHLFGGFD